MIVRPLTYPSLKCVLEHMEPNLRFKLAERCPSVRCAEKVTPIHIESLYLDSRVFAVNNTKYQLGIRRHFTTEPVPAYFQMENDLGGTYFDLDKFGREDLKSENGMTPGDVSIHDPPIVRESMTEEEYRHAIVLEKARLEELEAVENPSSEQKEEMDLKRSNIYDWNLFEQNKEAPYKMYIQLTITDETTQKVIRKEFMNYDRKLCVAMKYLLEKYFGNRRPYLRVKGFNLGPKTEVFRLPQGLKLKIRELETGSHVKGTLNAFKSIIIEESFPLEWFGIDGDLVFEDPENHDHKMIRSAKCLSLYNVDPLHSWFHIVARVQNQRADFTHCLLASEEFVAVADKMVDDQRSIGTEFEFEVTNQTLMKEMFERLIGRIGVIKQKEEGRGCKQFPYTVRLPMRDGLTLSIFCDDYNDDSGGNKSSVSKWMLHLKVETLFISSMLDLVLNGMWKTVMKLIDSVLFMRKYDLV